MKDKVLSKIQALGKAFMLPIAVLPIAGLFLAIGAVFTNPVNIKLYKMESVLGTVLYENGVYSMTTKLPLYHIFSTISKAGDIIFSNLPLIFAIAVAIAFAFSEKEISAFSSAIFFLVMHRTISSLLEAFNPVLPAGSKTMVLGIESLQMGVFGGIIAGLIVAYLHNKYYKIQLTEMLAFFSGTKFVPIISAITAILTGIISYFVWPYIQIGILSIGSLINLLGYAGTFIFGFTERALIPFGLHHVFYLPFWQTAVGGSKEIAGRLVEGAQNILFAELGDPNFVGPYSIEYARFMSGKFLLMMFGLPAAALAMYTVSKKNKRSKVKSLLFSAAFTAVLTGITEPIEFTFLFVAPFLYFIHCIFAGIAFTLMHIFNIPIGLTFSGGLIDFFLFGILQGNLKSHWLRILPLGIIYFTVYYFLFRAVILKFDLKTPGREDDDDEKISSNENKTNITEQSKIILEALGGKENLLNVEACITRLRLEVVNSNIIDEATLKENGAKAVMKVGTSGVQVVFGPKVTVIKSEIDELRKK
ncbi:PTS transporter subunit EIIC [Caviibacter abscessus]|uniref:PTS transporter subunit EIIC n=1 Tax=Caviibacter abscessus TaxID=1766719 RepID=UPI00082F2DA2|nr:PTS transporter subunit EIIC [Caviibacter abscessus]